MYRNNLRQLRKVAGISQSELADAIGSTLRVVGSWERGEGDMPLDMAIKSCEALGCTLNQLAGIEDEKPSTEYEIVSFGIDDIDMIGSYSKMSDDEKEAVRNMVRVMARSEINA